MTREEMIEWLKLNKHITTRGNRDFESDYAQGCSDGYEYAEVDFNSRTCEKCDIRITSLKKHINFLSDMDRERIEWREIVREICKDDNSIFLEYEQDMIRRRVA